AQAWRIQLRRTRARRGCASRSRSRREWGVRRATRRGSSTVTLAGGAGTLAGPEPLIDAHAHFYHAAAGRADWREVNDARFRAGERIGITCHVASVLGSYGFSSPTYFPSPDDVSVGNDAMLELCAREPDRVRMFVTVNPNYTAHALAEIDRC